jgi:hypothetical protein
MSDPLAATYRSALREARVVLLVWFFALCWTVGYCYLHGYPHDPAGWLVQNGLADARPAAITQTRLGMPMWVCYGIFAPAACCSVITLAFGLFFMRDDALGVEAGEEQP